jgi:hypothetical protein
MKKVYVGFMDFAGYTVIAVGATEDQVMKAIRKSVTTSAYWKDGEWRGRSWSEAWEYFGGHIDHFRLGDAQWL